MSERRLEDASENVNGTQNTKLKVMEYFKMCAVEQDSQTAIQSRLQEIKTMHV